MGQARQISESDTSREVHTSSGSIAEMGVVEPLGILLRYHRATEPQTPSITCIRPQGSMIMTGMEPGQPLQISITKCGMLPCSVDEYCGGTCNARNKS